MSDTPKLFINGDPGAVIFGNLRDYCRTWKNQQEVTVRGRHYLQEDSPCEIGQTIVAWLASIANRQSRGMQAHKPPQVIPRISASQFSASFGRHTS